MPASRFNRHHFVFTPKHRSEIPAPVRDALPRLFNEIAFLRDIGILELAVMDDHVHMLADLPRSMSPVKCAELVKWYTSLYIRRDFPELRAQVDADHFWGHKFYSVSVSVSGAAPKTVARYINAQKVTLEDDLPF